MNSSPKLTVMQLLPALESGGVERGTIEVARALRQHGHRAMVVSAGGAMVHELNRMSVEHLQWEIGKKSPMTFSYVWKLRQFLRQHPVDILHARSRLPAWIAWLAWKSLPHARRPHFVTTVHGQYSVKRYSAIMTRGEAVIAVSNTIKKYIVENYPDVDKKRIHVIPRGVDRQVFAHDYSPDQDWLNQWYRQYPALKGRKLITLPGRLTRLKGHQDFIQLMNVLRKKGVDVCGLIVGGEDPRRQAYADELRSSVREHDLQDRVLFTGKRDDMREILSVSDIVLSLSQKPESFGRTTLEALSLGVPVIGYDHGGVGEVLQQVFPQGAIPPGKTLNLAGKVISMLETSPAVPAEHPYSLQAMLDSTLALYASLVDGN